MSAQDEERRREDLAATSESLLSDARRITRIEEEKQHLDIDDPLLDKLSREAEEVAGEIQHKSRVERVLSDEGPTEPDEPGEQSRPH
jgi:hypothetical protein